GVVDVAGPRRTLLVGLAVFVAMWLAYLQVDSLSLLLAVRFVHGAAFGLVSTAATTLAQSAIPAARRGEGTGYYAMSVPFASGIGPLLALWLIDRWDYQALFVTSAVVSALAFVAAALLHRPPAREEGTAPVRPRWRDMVHPQVV